MSLSLKCGCDNEKCTAELTLTYINYDDQNFTELLLYNNGTPNSFYLYKNNIRPLIKELTILEKKLSYTKLMSQTCEKCFKEMRFEFSVDNYIWNKLPTKWNNKVLCIECFLEEIEKVSPNEKIELDKFNFLGIVGINAENNNFGGILLDRNL